MKKVTPLFNNELEIEKDANLFPLAEAQPERLEKHLIGLAKQSYNTDEPTQAQINNVANILEHDLGFE